MIEIIFIIQNIFLSRFVSYRNQHNNWMKGNPQHGFRLYRRVGFILQFLKI